MNHTEMAALLSKRLGCFVERSVGWTPDGESNQSNTERFVVHMEWEDLWQFYLAELRAEFATLGCELWAVQGVVCVQVIGEERANARSSKGVDIRHPVHDPGDDTWLEG